MADLKFYINNILIPPPNDWENLEIELNFVNNSPDATIKTTVFEWLGDNAHILYDWYIQGLNGGLGIYEGPQFRIESCDPGVIVFDGCIDMTSEETTFQCDIVKASVKETNRIQFFRDRAQQVPFSLLARPIAQSGAGLITKSDYVAVPYIISRIPDYLEVMILGVSFIELYRIIDDSITELEKLTTKIGGDSELIVATAPTTFGASLPASILYIAEVVLEVAYVALLMTLASALFLQILANLMQLEKYKFGMKVKVLFQKACQYLGMGFSSTLLGFSCDKNGNILTNDSNNPYNNLCIIPQKQANFGNSSFAQDFFNAFLGGSFTRKHYDDAKNTANADPLDNAYGYYDGTLAQLIEDVDPVFNITDPVSGQSGLIVRNNTLYLENWKFWNEQSQFVMPNQSSEAPFSDPFGTNAGKLAVNYLVIFNQDGEDNNTYDNYNGTQSMMCLQPNSVINPLNLLLKNLTQRRLNFSKASRKTKLTGPEEVFNVLVEAVGGLYNIILVPVINGITTAYNDFANAINFISFGLITIETLPNINPIDTHQIEERINDMLLGTDFIGVQKLVCLLSRGDSVSGVPIYNINPNNSRQDRLGFTDAHYLNLTYHSTSWAITPNKNIHNQYSTFKNKEIPLCCSDFAILRLNNVIKTYDQKLGRIDTIQWNPHLETAKTDFRVNERFTNNLKQTLLIDGQ